MVDSLCDWRIHPSESLLDAFHWFWSASQVVRLTRQTDGFGAIPARYRALHWLKTLSMQNNEGKHNGGAGAAALFSGYEYKHSPCCRTDADAVRAPSRSTSTALQASQPAALRRVLARLS